MFVQELYRRKGGVLLHNEYFFQIGGIAEPDASFCKTVIDFVFRMVNNDDAVCGNCSFNFQKESAFDLCIIQPADMIRFGEETVHRGFSAEGGMGRLIVSIDKCVQGGAQSVKGMESAHVKGSHPLVLHGAEPSFDLCLCRWRVRLAVIEGGADPCAEKLHLPVLIGTAVVKVEYLWPAVSGDGRAHDGHKIYKVVLEKDVNAGDKTACVIDQRNDIDFLFPLSVIILGPTLESPHQTSLMWGRS